MADTITVLTVADVVVQRDADGRFSLNDLHRAAGGEERHRPSRWVENLQTQELVDELSKAGIPALEVVRGGAFPGIFGMYEMVYAYAMWISAAFCVKVIRGYHASITGAASLGGRAGAAAQASPQGITSVQRQAAKLVEQIQQAQNPAAQRLFYGHLRQLQALLGQDTPSIEDLVLARDPLQGNLPGMDATGSAA
jgi:hypothetical protein